MTFPIPTESCGSDEQITIGPGLKRLTGSKIIATQSGVLRSKGSNVFWLDTHCRRYVPVQGDNVIGILTQKQGDIYRLDIGAADLGSIHYLSFEGATKRMKPVIAVGDLIFCQLALAIKDMEPELTCVDSIDGKAKGMGKLPDGGLMFQTHLNIVRKILSPKCNLLRDLGKELRFEITCGVNGRVWIKSNSVKETIAIANVIQKCAYLSDSEMSDLIKETVDKLRGF